VTPGRFAGRLAALAAFTVALWLTDALPAAAAGPCDAVGWREVTSGGRSIRAVSSLAGAAHGERVFAGSRQGTDNVMLWSGAPAAEQWQAETAFTGIPVTDGLVTPGRATDVWISTFGAAPGYNGPVLGRGSGQLFSPRGTLRSWFMALAATQSDVFVAVSKPDDRGVYRWDEANLEWTLQGGSGIDTVVFRTLEAGPDGRLWLGTDARGLWRSDDGGASWLPSGEAPDWTVWSVAVAPYDARTLLAGLGPPDAAVGVTGYPRGLRLSSDGGERWVDVSPRPVVDTAGDVITALAFRADETGTAFAAAWKSGLFASHDGGLSWSPLAVPGEQQRFFEALLVLPVSDTCELLYAAGTDGLWARNLAARHQTAYLPVTVRSATTGAR